MSLAEVAARVAAAAHAHDLLTPQARVLLAVSGGPDSTALAVVMQALREHGLPLHLELAHVDHGWRGEAASAKERRVVRILAERLRLPVHFVPTDPSVPKTEDGARSFRYRAFADLLESHDLSAVATGHHQGDQAETLLMRLWRGSGPYGLAGIPRSRPLRDGRFRVVRPLLDERPEDLRALIRGQGLSWVEDPTNHAPQHDRARAREALRLRHDLSGEDLVAVAKEMRTGIEERERTLRASLGNALRHHPLACAVELPRAIAQEQRGIWMDQLLRIMGARLHADRDGPWFTRRHVAAVEALTKRGGGLDLPRGLHWHARGRRAWLWRRQADPMEVTLEATKAACMDVATTLASRGTTEALLDASHVLEPRLRRLRPGDVFSPWGRGQPRRTPVAAWLKRRGIPRAVRERQWIVEGAQGIAWVVGHRIDRHAALTEASDRYWRVRVARS